MASIHTASSSVSILNSTTTAAAAASSSSFSSTSCSSCNGVQYSLISKSRLLIVLPLYLQSRTIASSGRFVCCRGSRSGSRMSVIAAAKIVPSEQKEEVSSLESSVDELFEDEMLLPENVPDFWEGPQWNALGFVIQYLWAFGVLVALVACGIAVRTYNLGATDFRDTAVFKEAIQTQEKLQTAPETDSDDSTDPLLLDAPPLQES